MSRSIRAMLCPRREGGSLKGRFKKNVARGGASNIKKY